MITYKKVRRDNFFKFRFLEKYLEGHKGFIAGGCFKNILNGETLKDIDIFFEDEFDFHSAVDLFNSSEYVRNGWKFKYRNDKACAFQKEGEKIWVELIESVFGTPEEILRQFDFTVCKMAYVKESLTFGSADVKNEFHVLYVEDFFEHLQMKRLVIDEEIPFPIGTWERSYRYKAYGFNLCRESKGKLLDAIRSSEDEFSMYNNGGWY